ncbi:hypothetical protein GYMLUDRAFT_60492 [Collybiopsis luxurians FD-317 M1]|uniref:Uncharacterized protein n=1 Tax=Collybiopsis luxurians FD-317 M1 TaxID=944289 RepID=A0A0D0CSM8_9AGAR|nr:hypothetical protein GYMLUDRAFT_60492 [Collybiopsis luxurians FD-317 M1]
MACSLSSSPSAITLGERKRLVRSARKLSDVLGATPRIEAGAPNDFEVATTSRPRLRGDSTPRRAPVLSLFLPDSSRRTIDHSDLPSPIPSPSPTADTHPKPGLRRIRSWAKLTRVLGSNVPSESYPRSSLPPCPRPTEHPPSSWHGLATPESTNTHASPVTTDENPDGSSTPRKQAKLRRKHDESNKRPSTEPSPRESGNSSSASSFKIRRSTTVSSCSRKEQDQREGSSGRREERNWEGEWNRQSIVEVIDALRQLKSS